MLALEIAQSPSALEFAVREPAFRHGDVDLHILLPRSADELIDAGAFERDERLPYWADLWPGARALARHLLDHPPLPRACTSGAVPGVGGDLRIIELGCGAAALASLVLTMRGYEVLATDYEPEALKLVGANAMRNGVTHEPLDGPRHSHILENVSMSSADVAAEIEVLPSIDRSPRTGRMRTRTLDWRDPPPDLGLFDLVLASDLMYEQRNAIALADLVPRILSPGGTMLLADPGRRYLPQFQMAMRQRGWVERDVATIREPHVDPSRPASNVRIIEFSLAVNT